MEEQIRGDSGFPGFDASRRLSALLGICVAMLIGSALGAAPAMSAAPSNDNFVGAVTLTGQTPGASGTVTDSTVESGEDTLGGLVTGTVWYKWTAPSTGFLVFDSGTGDTAISFGSGNSASTWSMQWISVPPYSSDPISVTGGNTYQFRVMRAGPNAPGQNFSFAFSMDSGTPPGNDNFGSAIVLTGSSGSVSGTTRYATRESGEPGHGLSGNPTVWYQWTATQKGVLTVSDCYGISAIVGYTGSTVSALTERSSLSCDWPANLPVAPGDTIRIAVVGPNPGTAMGFDYEFTPSPANDDFANGQTISGSLIASTGSTAGATREPDEPVSNDPDRTATVWYRWTAPANGVARVDVCGFSHDSSRDVGVFTGTSLIDLFLVDGAYCQVTFPVVAGTDYRIVVASDAAQSMFDLNVELLSPPANDSFSSAEVLTGTDTSSSGTLVGGSIQSGEPDHYGSGANSSVWYSWVAPQAGTLFVSACEDEIEGLAIYTGSSVDALTEAGSGSCSALAKVSSGTQYRIAVAGNSVDGRDFDLHLQLASPPTNNDFSGAETMTGTVSGTTVGATRQSGEPTHGLPQAESTVWYRWVAQEDGDAVIGDCLSDYVAAVAIYSGSSLANLNSLREGGCEVEVEVQSGATYWIAVVSYASWWGAFDLHAGVLHPPANDDFESAEVLSGSSPESTGETSLASKQPGEPSHNSKSGTASVWYSWTAPQDGILTVNVCGGFDTVVAVYTGTSVNALTGVTSNDDFHTGNCSSGYESQVTFNVTAGNAYRIAVDGYGSSSKGDFEIRLSLGSGPVSHGLTVARSGAGTGTVTSSPSGISCGSVCTASFPEGTIVTLTAAAGGTSVFDGWSGACSGTGSCEVTMSEARNVTAGFSIKPGPARYVLTVSKAGNGTGTVTSSPAGIQCGATCSAEYGENTVVTLSAAPGPGSTFLGWSGACIESGPCEVVMSDVRKVTARFTAPEQIPPPTPDPAALTLSRLALKPGSVKAGGSTTLSARVANTGGSESGPSKLCPSVAKAAGKFLKLPACASFGELAPGTSKTFRFKIRSTRKARGKVKITLTVSSAGGVLSAAKNLKIKPAGKRR